jgi:hypothetical protein
VTAVTALAKTAGVHPAVLAARRVVGFYGDVAVSWSIMVDARLTAAVEPEVLRERLVDVVRENPHLGLPPRFEVVAPADLDHVRQVFADEPYGNQEPLVRGAVDTTGRRVLVAVHHGAADGFGMLAILSRLLDTDLRSSTRGVLGAVPHTSFVRSSVGRLVEAAFRPPQRFEPDVVTGTGGEGDWIVERNIDALKPGTPAMVVAVRLALLDWNAVQGRRSHRPVVIAVGASKRDHTQAPSPDRETAYLRLADVDVSASAKARELLMATPPEPDFPVSTGLGIAPMVTKVLRNRLGSSALVSNLGRVDGRGVVDHIVLFPCATGPSGVAVGLTSVDGTTNLLVRARRADLSETAAREIHARIARHLEAGI